MKNSFWTQLFGHSDSLSIPPPKHFGETYIRLGDAADSLVDRVYYYLKAVNHKIYDKEYNKNLLDKIMQILSNPRTSNLQQYPAILSSLKELGFTAFSNSDYDSAITAFLKAKTLRNPDPEILLALAQAYWKKQNYVESSNLYQTVLKSISGSQVTTIENEYIALQNEAATYFETLGDAKKTTFQERNKIKDYLQASRFTAPSSDQFKRLTEKLISCSFKALNKVIIEHSSPLDQDILLALAQALVGKKNFQAGHCIYQTLFYSTPENQRNTIEEQFAEHKCQLAAYYEKEGDQTSIAHEKLSHYGIAMNYSKRTLVQATRIKVKMGACHIKDYAEKMKISSPKSLLSSITSLITSSSPNTQLIEDIKTTLQGIKGFIALMSECQELDSDLASISDASKQDKQLSFDCLYTAYQLNPDKYRDKLFALCIEFKFYKEAWDCYPEKCQGFADKIFQSCLTASEFDKALTIIKKFPLQKYSKTQNLKNFLSGKANALYDQGSLEEKANNYIEALRLYQESLAKFQEAYSLFPDNDLKERVSQLHRKVGNAHYHLNQLEAAGESYKSSLELEIAIDKLLRSSIMQLAQKQLEMADESILVTLEDFYGRDYETQKKHKNNPTIIKAREQALKALDQAIAHLEQIVDENHAQKEWRKLLAKLHYKKGDLLDYFESQGYLEAFSRAVDLNPDNPYYCERLCGLYAHLGNETAKKEYRELGEKNMYEGFGMVFLKYSDEQYKKKKFYVGYSEGLDIHAFQPS